MKIETFIRHVRSCPFPRAQGVFNPWQESDTRHDIGPAAPAIRRRHLIHYLRSRLGRARFCLIGEALSYQGGHFTGLAMTSERILLGHKRSADIRPQDVLPGTTPRRTSRPEIKPRGFSENTASIVWKMLMTLPGAPLAYVIWNTFPWHPFDPGRGILSNRQPTLNEVKAGKRILNEFIGFFPGAVVLAVGKTAGYSLAELDIPHTVLRHPSMAGGPTFRAQLNLAVRQSRLRRE